MMIKITKDVMPDAHWLVYTNADGAVKHVGLSGCANNFSAVTGIVSDDGLRCVGWRYEENGKRCYELFNVGHLVLFAPLHPNPFERLLYLLQGKNPEEAYAQKLEQFEAALRLGGWKTMPRPEQV